MMEPASSEAASQQQQHQQLLTLHVDNTMARVRSPTWNRSWEVPQQLISMTAASIARLMTDAVLPPVDLLSSASCSSLSSSSAFIAEQIQHAHNVLIGLASSHSAIKYWLYMRMFWLCQGQADGDAVVLERIADVENIKDKSPSVRRHWDHVKRGLAAMEVLLGRRQALMDLMGCRAVVLDQLLQLKTCYLDERPLLHLVREVRSFERAAQGKRDAKLTMARLNDMCKQYDALESPTPAPEPDVAETTAKLVFVSHRRRSERTQAAEQSSAPAKRLRTRPHRLMAESNTPALKRRARTSLATVRSYERRGTSSAVNVSVDLPGSEEDEDDGKADGDAMQEEDTVSLPGGSRIARSTVPPVADGSESSEADGNDDDMDRKNEHELGGADDLEQRALPSAPPSDARILHDALVRLHSMPVLTYYLGLLRQFPDLLSVAAPYGYTDDGPAGGRLYEHTIQHRLQDHCASRLLLYTNEYLLQHSDELQLLPALMVDGEGSPALRCSPDDAAAAHAATKVWLFFPDHEEEEEDEMRCDRLSNSAQALAVYHRFHRGGEASASSSSSSSSSSDSPPSVASSPASALWDEQGGRLLSLPPELLLQAGVRALLVVQRAGETVSMPGSSPSRYDSPCAHMVHTLPSVAVLSVAGNYCSAQHLVDHIEHQWASEAKQVRPPAPQMESVDVQYPAGVFSADSPMPPLPLLKPSLRWLEQRYEQMGNDPVHDRQAWASELQTPEQMMALINAQLDHDIAAKAPCPPPALLLKLGLLVSMAPTTADSKGLLALYTKAVAMTTTASRLPPHSSCSLRHGCGIARQVDVPALPDGHMAAPVFRFSSAPHVRPLLFLRCPNSLQRQQRVLAEEMVGRWSQGGDRHRYNVSWPTASTPSFNTGGSTVKDVSALWHERSDYRKMEPAPLLHHYLHPVHACYLQDICAHDKTVRGETIARLSAVLPSALISGGALRHCAVPTEGVHTPSFYLLRASTFALSQHIAAAALTDIHNESQRLGFWHHLLPCEATALERQHDDTDAVVPSGGEATQARLNAMYKLYGELTNLSAAADAFAQSVVDGLSSFVSTAYGELTQACVGKMLDCMMRRGLRRDDVFFDVGSGYGRALAHVALATGVAAVGIEAVPARHRLAKDCLEACGKKSLDVSRVHLHEGDVLANLHLLLCATHVLVFDARFQPETRAILRHLWRHLAGSKLRLLFCEKTREKSTAAAEEHGIEAVSTRRSGQLEGFELLEDIKMTTGHNRFTMCVLRPLSSAADSNLPSVEVAVFAGHRVGLRARRAFAADEEVIEVLGERLTLSGWAKLKDAASNPRWQWTLHRRGERTHVLNVARFVNGPQSTTERGERAVRGGGARRQSGHLPA